MIHKWKKKEEVITSCEASCKWERILNVKWLVTGSENFRFYAEHREIKRL